MIMSSTRVHKCVLIGYTYIYLELTLNVYELID